VRSALPHAARVRKATRVRQLDWWSKQFSGLPRGDHGGSHLEGARQAVGRKLHARQAAQDKKTGALITPKEYKRSGATVNRFLATLSHTFSFAVKERRLMERNPVSAARRRGSRACPSALPVACSTTRLLGPPRFHDSEGTVSLRFPDEALETLFPKLYPQTR
jgi:hypothetical protein